MKEEELEILASSDLLVQGQQALTLAVLVSICPFVFVCFVMCTTHRIICFTVIPFGWCIHKIYQLLKPISLTDTPAASAIYRHLARGRL